MTTPLVGPLLDALAQIPTDEPALAAEIDTIRSRLSEPLRVVLAGRVSTGKSTLLNGLLGQAVAPTDYSECTQAVTWFRYGFQQKVEVRLRDGSTKELNLSVDGRLPRQLGVEISEIQDVQVSLANEALRSFTLVDTPGFSSGRASGGAEGKELAAAMDRRSRQAAAACDAMIFVLNGTLRADELEVLNAFQDAQHGPASAVNAIGALTKADQLGDGDEDPLEVAAGLAKRYAQRHAKDVSDVVPVVGLFAETAEAGLLTERDVANLALLSGLDAEAQTDLLASVDDFRDERCTVVDVPARARLLEKLGLYGVQRAVSLVRGGADSAGLLRRELSRESGIEALRRALEDGFGERRTPLRLLWALEAVERLSYRRDMPPAAAAAARDAVERIRFDPVMHEVQELEAYHRCCSGQVRLPPELEEDVRRLALERYPMARLRADSDSPQELRSAALAAAARWRKFRLYARPSTDEVARTVLRSYQLALTGGPQR